MALNLTLPHEVYTVVERLAQYGHKAYPVGGCVRDIAMGRTPSDYDLSTDASSEVVLSLFPRSVATGLRFGTVSVRVDGRSVEVTSFRSEGPYLDGRHPSEVKFGVSLEDDLARRDFTINAMAADISTGTLIDLHDGLRDIQMRVVRAVGNPHIRIAEDRLRMLRAVRFAAVLDFDIEMETLSAIKESASSISEVSVERVTFELQKMLLAARPSKGIELMRETGLLSSILPEVLSGWEVHQNKYHEFTVYYHTLACLDAVLPSPALRWAALLHDVGKPQVKQGQHFYGHEGVSAELARGVADRLKLPTKLARHVCHLIKNHMVGYNSSWSDGAIRRLIARVGRESIDDFLELHRADTVAKTADDLEGKMVRYEELRTRVLSELRSGNATVVADLAIGGDDVAKILGASGPRVGAVLSELLKRVIDNPDMNRRDRLTAAVEEMR